MIEYSNSFEQAVSKAMCYEVGSFWSCDAPGVADGSISTPQERRACGYTDDPTDNGGETKFGVSKSANPDLDIASLTWDGAKRVYYRRYWVAASCSDLDSLCGPLAMLHFDGAVNHGTGRAVRFLQQAVGVEVDGDYGPATHAAVQAALQSDSTGAALCDAICDLRAAFYKQIVVKNPSQGKYLNGWLRRIEEMRTFVKQSTA